ncbi:MAG: head-tail connector protein [Fusobacterium sp.]|uniref:head-tail connector protein n=1 Tax=Fusobacterium sp. TaxID=68766 RepID=UPI002A7510D6|nr:head-tail connector protein [Fusobacterium sp.]MDY2980189.1 head-tail connector protein [Fusobacterium sp.]
MTTISLEEAKAYLRIDCNDENNYINDLLEYSKEEIKNSTGDDGSNPSYTYRMTQLLIIADRFENRGSNDGEFKPNNALSCHLLKLKYKGEQP